MGKKRFQRHFRKGHDKNIQGHPVYAFSEEKDKYNVVVITHGRKTRNIKNISLKENPNPSDKEKKSYLYPYVQKTNKKGKVLTGWKFNNSDQLVVEDLIKKNKKRKDCGRK